MTVNKNPQDVVFSPQQASTLGVEAIEYRKNVKPGLPSGVPGLDNYLLPLRPGEVMAVIGYASNYKTGLLSFIARNAIQETEKYPDHIVIYISWEQSVEEQVILDMAYSTKIEAGKLYKGDLNELEWAEMMRGALARASKPLWVIGHSEAANRRRPRLSMSDVAYALEYIVDVQGKKPILVVLDYLQRISREDCKGTDTRSNFMEVVDRVKDLSLSFRTPVILGTQAGRHVLERKWQQPGIADSQETSNLEQTADKMLSVWMPKTSYPLDTPIGPKGREERFTVSQNLLFLELLKQRYGMAPVLFPLYVKPEVNEIYRLADVVKDQNEKAFEGTLPYDDD